MKYISQDADNLPRFIKAGDYLLTVLEATETVSKAGDDMIKLKLEVEGHGVRLFDYLVATESSFWKIDTFLKAIGETVVEGEEVELVASSLEGRQGYAHLVIEEYQGKQNNKVDAWITKPIPKVSAKPASTAKSYTPTPAKSNESTSITTAQLANDNEPF